MILSIQDFRRSVDRPQWSNLWVIESLNGGIPCTDQVLRLSKQMTCVAAKLCVQQGLAERSGECASMDYHLLVTHSSAGGLPLPIMAALFIGLDVPSGEVGIMQRRQLLRMYWPLRVDVQSSELGSTQPRIKRERRSCHRPFSWRTEHQN